MTPYEVTKVVLAEQLTVENAVVLAHLVSGVWQETIEMRSGYGPAWLGGLSWNNTHGYHAARPGDYVVQEPDGSYHAWDRDVFEATFRPKSVLSEYADDDPLRIPKCF